MTATIQMRSLSHRFGSFPALSQIDLTIEAGSFAVLLGPSGCGKTTLLSILGGFLTPTQGQVLLNGEDVTRVTPERRPTTTMFQDYALFPHMTLLDNVGFGLRMRGLSRSRRHADAREMLALVGLSEEYAKKPHQLSGGQRQRVALARALAVKPEVLLLDEPLGALDLNLRRLMQEELKAIQHQVGTTFIHVTHDQEEAMAIADEIIVMNAGRIEDKGAPESIYLKPRTLFTAGFMGEANFVPGEIMSVTADELLIDTAFGSWSLPRSSLDRSSPDRSSPDRPSPDRSEAAAGQCVYACFRPEHVLEVSLAAREDDFSKGATYTVTTPADCVPLGHRLVMDHAFSGTHQRCHVDSPRQQPLLANLPQNRKVENGQALDLGVRRESIVLFAR
ncbi:MAG: ABC transporter ATP-binding protein [Granulosicoccus sp.]|nr:ABC transporter ATP-binding protein [Granulosicoccus sp.]